MSKKFGLQLYTVREKLKSREEIAEVLAEIKSIGYDTIQTYAGIKSVSVKELGELAKAAGLEVCGAFVDFEMMKIDGEKSNETALLLGTKDLGTSWMRFESDDDVTALIDGINKAAENLSPYGIKFSYHNHYKEFTKYKYKTAFDFIMENASENVSFCFDTYWAQVGGVDVREYIRRLSGRIDILHLKDYCIKNGQALFASVGDGNLYWDGIIAEAENAGVKHYVVEQDDCGDMDVFEAIKRSRDFLEKYN